MNKFISISSNLIPGMTVFVSSGCIMVLEIVAGRLIARDLGSSLYTWTSVIGVILAGVAIGNYLGGRIADRFPAKKTLSVLFGISSVACVGIIILHNLVGEWTWLHNFNWPLRVLSHVACVFLIPSIQLGTISPVVSKMALDRGLLIGRTIGCLYAWGAVGSIVGTFLAGFYLIAVMGTIAIIWTVGTVLLLMGILYWFRQYWLYIWLIFFIILMIIVTGQADWAQKVSAKLALREKHNPRIIYETESQYSYIAVETISTNPDIRRLVQDKTTQSVVNMDKITDLKSHYEQIFSIVTHQLSKDKEKLKILMLGGGGYVFPRYVDKMWPESHIEVVEIDPKVTEAVMEGLGLDKNTLINTITMDARNYVNELLNKECENSAFPKYDFIYGDAFNNYSIPYQLVTKEFNDKIAHTLDDNGAYILNILDVFGTGHLLGAIINTLEETFPGIMVLSKRYAKTSTRLCNFIVVATKQKNNSEELRKVISMRRLWLLSNSDMEILKKRAREIILTDNYVPVENLFAPAVLKWKAPQKLYQLK